MSEVSLDSQESTFSNYNVPKYPQDNKFSNYIKFWKILPQDLRDAGPSNDRNQQFSLDFSDNLSQTSPASRSILEKDKQFFCSSCEKWFKSLRGLNIHKSKSHSFQKQRQVNDNISSANSQQKSSLKNKSVEIQCNFCNKRFKTQKGINQHVTIKHVNASTNNTNEHNILDSFSINSLLTKLKSSTSVIKRIPKGARTCISEELASVLNTCVKENSLKSWFHLLIFSYIVLKVPDKCTANRNKSLTSLVKDNLAIWQNLTTLPLDQLNDYLRRNNKPPQIKKVNHPQKDNQLSKKIEGKMAEGDIKGAIRCGWDVFWAQRIKMSKKHITAEQKSNLVDFLKDHPQMYRGKFTPTYTHAHSKALWTELGNELNALPNGANKDWIHWRKLDHGMETDVETEVKLQSDDVTAVEPELLVGVAQAKTSSIPTTPSTVQTRAAAGPSTSGSGKRTNKTMRLTESIKNNKRFLQVTEEGMKQTNNYQEEKLKLLKSYYEQKINIENKKVKVLGDISNGIDNISKYINELI
ncbi:unnamed protein product [Ceutorhynchus assimilis]|uniref:C2H2-type domain-containing protein n=1 Tax=Ceutorhynchus assimilis TaxID=467358 RepID=A0A9N9MM93_9CUCU|nr:unnamed protein product [Ceutorhynchus assimilis]